MANKDSFVIDIENGPDRSGGGGGSPDLSCDKGRTVTSFTACTTAVSIDELVKCENPPGNVKKAGELSPDSAKVSIKKEKRKSTGAKKPPKPPRPPRGLSLDAADQKLIKEISELAMIKRARIERMKALKKMKAAKASSVTASSGGNFIALLFTILFCVVIIFQGCHSSASSPGSSSVESDGATRGNSVLVQDQLNFPNNGVPSTSVEAPNQLELVSSASEIKYKGRKAIN